MRTILKQLRQSIVSDLWATYRDNTPQMQRIVTGLKNKGINKLPLDHFAIIDLPGPNTGIPQLKEIFMSLGYVERGHDYLADKQNDFLWMTEEDSFNSNAQNVLPQVVVADFRVVEMPNEIRKIIENYACQTPLAPIKTIQHYIATNRIQEVKPLLTKYFTGRDWPLPTKKEFYLVHEFNELLAWVLVFGRKPNHFTLSIHLLNVFKTLMDFHHFVENEMQLPLNCDGGKIKGGETVGIAQGATMGAPQKINLADGEIELPLGFVEFVWRYPCQSSCKTPILWSDYFTDFIAQNANRVIESLYLNETLCHPETPLKNMSG